MGLLTRLFNFTPGGVIDSEQVDAEFDQIIGEINGQLDDDNLSLSGITKFLKLATPGNRKEAFGVSDNGGASWGFAADREFNIAHGLGATPAEVFLTGETAVSTASGVDPTVCSIVSVDATNIRVRQSTFYRGTCNVPDARVHWRAIV